MVWYPRCTCTETNVCVSEKDSNAIQIGNSDTATTLHCALLPLFAHYIELVLAAHTGQKSLIVRVNRASTMDHL